MKYKIIQDNLRFGEEGEILPDAEAELLNIPILLEKGFIEEVKEDWKRWRAEIGERYYNVSADGEIEDFSEGDNKWNYYKYITGNYFKTQEEAQQKLDRDLAIARVNNRIRELQGGDMSVEEKINYWKRKYDIIYISPKKQYDWRLYNDYHQFILLPIRTQEIAYQIIKECKDDLDIIWGIKK